ncbi:alpha-glycosidase [Cytobacillus sp. FJAT-54145]|uniref:Alpha-glycosidase n=1 Tax=Cytobacillus spartinae TaxID=3299023 RepID=A0ABW6K9Q1_9BACI
MEQSSVYHRPTDQFAYPYSKDTLHIKIRTKRSNVQNIELIYGDQYEWENDHWICYTDQLEKAGTDSLFDYWKIAVKPEYRRLRYGFKLISNEEQIIYTEKGFYPTQPGDPGLYFCFPYLHQNQVSHPPSWVKDTVWYQIFPERFANGDPTNDSKDTKAWGSESPTAINYFGGDFQGVMNHIEYLKELGISGIYFTPIFKAYSNHKYDTIDYFEIDPQFGDKETFRLLVRKCHKHGIKVMLDAVFNHSGYHFKPFQDVLQNGEKSPYKNWFYTSDFPLKGGERPNYATFSFVETMPKLNTQNQEVKDYLMEVGCYWIREFDIDGWRLDVANEIDHQFWREFRTKVKAIKPDVFILGEVWHDSMPWLRGDQFDSVMNYPFLTNLIHFFAKELIDTRQFVENMTTVMQLYPDTVNEGIFNIIGSHDTSRIVTECDGRVEKVKLIFTFLLTFLGSPCIYYGDEIGLSGENDPDCRKCMPWDQKEWNKELLSHVKFLIHLRKTIRVLANEGSFTFLEPHEGLSSLAYLRKGIDQSILVIINPTNMQEKYPIPLSLKGKKISNLKDNSEYAAEAHHLSVDLGPYDYSILSF